MSIARSVSIKTGLYELYNNYQIQKQDHKLKDAWTQYAIKKMGDKAIFDRVEIETFNRCNGSCQFCPVNKNVDPRQPRKMEEKLFYNILSQLGELDYNGYICLFSNNEALLDKRIINWIEKAREILPNAIHYLYTNGTLLDHDKHAALSKSLDALIIDNYDGGVYNYPEMLNRMRTVVKERRRDELLTNRGGLAPNRKPVRGLKTPCPYPFSQLVIRPDGHLSLCCNDATGKTDMGDLNTMSLMDAWQSPYYVDTRIKMLNSRESTCPGCDTLLNGYNPF
jgi:MoaA/NifB/PqqE/SkfB family radical SAM enzyme